MNGIAITPHRPGLPRCNPRSYLEYRGQHQKSYHDRASCRCKGRKSREDRRQEQGAAANRIAAPRLKPGSSAFCPPDALYKGGSGGGTKNCADCGTSTESESSAPRLRGEAACASKDIGLGCHTDEGSEGIKHIYEQEREHDYQEIQ